VVLVLAVVVDSGRRLRLI